jgi:hypothetical protein
LGGVLGILQRTEQPERGHEHPALVAHQDLPERRYVPRLSPPDQCSQFKVLRLPAFCTRHWKRQFVHRILLP